MVEQKQELLTVGKIAEQLSVPAAKVKKAIQELGIKPTAKKVLAVIIRKVIYQRLKKH